MKAAQNDQSNSFCYYDHGWNACVRGEPFHQNATVDWKDGWLDCAEAAMNEGPQSEMD